MKGSRFLWSALIAIPLACVAAERGGAWLERVPPAARTVDNPFSNDPDATLAGSKLFQRHCASCHGRDAQGLGKAPALRSKVVREAPPGSLFWLLRDGILAHGMPSWSRLPDQRRWQIVTWLKSMQ